MKSKILRNCLIFGFLYFLLTTSIDYIDTFKVFFIIFMQFLPGVTFPISTTNYKQNKISNTKIVIHLILSVLIYYGNCWLFNYENKFHLSPVFAGFIGSFLYLICSKFILKFELKLKEILIASLISGICFLPNIIFDKYSYGITLGFALLTWTLTNGILISRAQK